MNDEQLELFEALLLAQGLKPTVNIRVDEDNETFVTIRLTEEERKLLDEKATASNVHIADFCYRALVDKIWEGYE